MNSQTENSHHPPVQAHASQESEAPHLKLLESVIAQSTEAIMITDANAARPRIVYVNAAYTRMTGYSAAEVIGQHPHILQGPQSDPQTRKSLGKALRKTQACEAEMINYKKNGETFWTHLSISPVTDTQGKTTHFMGIKRDITQRKQLEQALTDSEKRYSELFQLSPQPMWVFDLETLRFLNVNQAATQNYGYSQDEFLAMTLSDIRPPQDLPQLQQKLKTLKLSSGTTEHGLFRHRKKNGELIQVEIKSSELNYQGQPARLVIAQDVTERLQYIQAIESQNQKFREISWMQSHLVRAPLARIMALIDLLPELEEPTCDLQPLQAILDSAHELDTIIHEIVRKAETLDVSAQP